MRKNGMKKIVAFLVMVVMVFSLVACGSGSNSASSGDTVNTLNSVLAAGKLKVGIIMSTVPMGDYDESGTPYGYDVDTAQALADSLGVELEIVDVSAAERIPALQTGKVDCVIGAFTRNMTRAASVAFSDPYFACPAKIITLKGSTLTSDSKVEDLAGLAVGATKGGSTAERLEELNETMGLGMNLFLAETQAELRTALENGQIAAFAIDGSAVDYNVKQEPDKYQAGPAVSDPYYNCIGVNLDDLVWLNYINTFIKEENRVHFFSDLYYKYFGTECEYSLTPVY